MAGAALALPALSHPPGASAPGGNAPTETPDSPNGRSFRALLGRQANQAERPAARAGAVPDDAKAAADPVAADAAEPDEALVDETTDDRNHAADLAIATLDPALLHLLQPGAAPVATARAAIGVPKGEVAGDTAADPLAPAAGRAATPSLAVEADPSSARSPASARPALGLAARGPTRAEAANSAALPESAQPAEAGAPRFAALLAEAQGSKVEAAAPRQEAPSMLHATPAVAAPADIGPARHEAAAAPATVVHLPAAPDSPEFPGQFGVQIATFARDGIEHAELHLNPAEMGPVAVQIALDGTQARVELRADLAATRDALQQSLPALAAALREAGLTLAGGSVSAQAGGQGGQNRRDADDNPRAAGRIAAARGSVAGPAAAVRSARLGGVDLYA